MVNLHRAVPLVEEPCPVQADLLAPPPGMVRVAPLLSNANRSWLDLYPSRPLGESAYGSAEMLGGCSTSIGLSASVPKPLALRKPQKALHLPEHSFRLLLPAFI
jgi:hypothetical protein